MEDNALMTLVARRGNVSLIGRRCHRHTHAHTHAFTHSCEHTHAHAPKETLWEVISLPVPAMPGQPSGAATSLCPSVPRLCMVFLQAEREGERGRVCPSPPRHTQHTQTHKGPHGAPCPPVQTKRFYNSCSSWFIVCHFLCMCLCGVSAVVAGMFH